jgi:hypothetical protein
MVLQIVGIVLQIAEMIFSIGGIILQIAEIISAILAGIICKTIPFYSKNYFFTQKLIKKEIRLNKRSCARNIGVKFEIKRIPLKKRYPQCFLSVGGLTKLLSLTIPFS